MKQLRGNICVKSNDEMEVAAILIELPRLTQPQHKTRILPSLSSWGAKRKRSFDDNAIHRRLSLSLPPPVQDVDEPRKPAVKGKTSSPATPLAFCPSEADDKPKPSKRKLSVKKKKDELLKIIQDYTQSNEMLAKEVEKKRRYYDQLKARSLWLQTIEKENLQLSLANIKREKPQVETEVQASTRFLQVEVKPTDAAAAIDLKLVVEQRPSLTERTDDNNAEMGESYEYPHGLIIQSRSRLGMGMKNGPSGIPDLNASPEEFMWTMQLSHHTADDMNKSFTTKVIAAQARRRRMQIYKDKISNFTHKLRVSYR